ncbi:putative asparagine synthase [Mycena albidolilacea]|uniref:Asparagine synthase n=1 Tax=Mycena albidolilacea TaxID=1033008 RepID=A0AAD7ACG0_9AGAR|nr:putative asparagine synthase [Mycena albidolilacea]
MCGLTSVFHPDSTARPTADTLRDELEVSLESIKHRGPDSRGIYISPDARVGLGHVRLSIIDLATGQQPMSDEDQLIHCVVTGELYDHERIRTELESKGHTFKTKSDSELVVQLYKRDGINLLFHLRGEFAFVLYDVKRRFLFAARDRFGIKPLYYTVSKGRILFASEIKAFMGLGWHAEWDIDSIIHNGEVSDERTVFNGVQKLAAGHFALCGASGYIRTERYWDMSYPAANAPFTSTVDSAISNVRRLMVESVRLRLRSDVPLAVYLSGGIDSSAVAGIATHLLREKDPNAKLTTFTLAYIEDEKTDESPIALRTAAHLGAEVKIVNATESALVGVFEESVWHSEMVNATFHAAGKILLSKAVRSNGFKVALSGEGADEIFGGYSWFPLDYLRRPDPAAAGLGIPLPSEKERHAILANLERSAGAGAFSSVNVNVADSSLIKISSHHVTATLIPFYGSTFKPDIIEITGEPEIARAIVEGIDPRVRQNSISDTWHSLNVALYMTAKTFLGRIILNQVGDRADMVNAVENRVSCLDHHLVEYVNALPPSLKIMPIAGSKPGTWTFDEKWILRQAVKPFVTEEIYRRKKAAYNPPPRPAAVVGLAPLQLHLSQRITQSSVERLGIFHWPYIRNTLKDYIKSPSFHANGAIDERARILLGVLSFIVLQERFNVPTFRF